MHTKLLHFFRTKNPLSRLALGMIAMSAAFAVGLQTSGVSQPAQLVEAGSSLAGDMNSDGIITTEDVIILLEVSQGYREPTADQLRADPTADGHLTVEDALQVLRILSR